MNNINISSTSLHQMVSDASYFLAHVTPEAWLIALVVTAGSVYFLNRAKAPLVIALTGLIYLLPFLITGRL